MLNECIKLTPEECTSEIERFLEVNQVEKVFIVGSITGNCKLVIDIYEIFKEAGIKIDFLTLGEYKARLEGFPLVKINLA